MSAPAAAGRDPLDGPAEERRGFARWWAGLGRGQRALFAVLAVVVAANVALSVLGSVVGSSPGGPVSSSYSTGQDGLRGWHDLLRRDGRDVVRRRGAIAEADLRPDDAVVLADPGSVRAEDRRALRRFVIDGGRLVVVGDGSARVAAAVAGAPIPGEGPGGEVRRWVTVPETARTARLATSGTGYQDVRRPLLPVAGDAGGQPAVLVADVGAGRLVAVADVRVFWNRSLARADNAAFALDVTGRDGRVVFLEGVHGYEDTGLDALPGSWRFALTGLALALGLGLWSAGARFGAPEPAVRQLRPSRHEHVAALAADLDRVAASDADAVAPLHDATRAALAAAVGAAPDASDAVLWQAGTAAGVPPDDLELLTQPVASLDAALAVGAVAARRQRGAHGLPPAGTVPTDPRSGGAHP